WTCGSDLTDDGTRSADAKWARPQQARARDRKASARTDEPFLDHGCAGRRTRGNSDALEADLLSRLHATAQDLQRAESRQQASLRQHAVRGGDDSLAPGHGRASRRSYGNCYL